MKFISLNINSIRGKKKMDLLAFLDVHNPHIVAIQETKIDSSIAARNHSPKHVRTTYLGRTETFMVAE